MKASTKDGEYINEDGKLAQAYETQKTINKQLELELQDEKTRYKAHEKEYKYEIEKLHDDNERLSANLTSNPQSQSEAYTQHEINRLTQENLLLIDRNDLLNESVKKLKKQLKVLMKKLEELDDDPHNYTLKAETAPAVLTPQRSKSNIRKKEREYLGMFSIRDGEETIAMNRLVIDLKPRTAVTLLPALPSYIVFMCIRHADYMNDEEKVKVLLTSFLSCVRKVLRKRSDDFETRVLWLSNLRRFICNLKQYSSETTFQKENTPKQNEQCLRNFDLSDYRSVASDTAIYIFQEIMKVLEHKVRPLIVPAILECEEVSGGVNTTNPEVNYTRTLCKELTGHYKILQFYGVSSNVISQIFKQLYYFMCASSLNNLLLRKEFCNWSKGYQITLNLSHLEMWTREKNLDEESIKSMLQPIFQAAQLLQARKRDEDVTSICEMCSALTPPQISKILTLYTPSDGEQRVSPSFIKKVQEKLQERGDSSNQLTLLMDTKHRNPVNFFYTPSDICLEDIEIPEVLNLTMLEKI